MGLNYDNTRTRTNPEIFGATDAEKKSPTELFAEFYELQNGQPCPVCGATDHPSIAHKPEQAPTEDQLKDAKRAADQAQKRTEETNGDCRAARTAFEEQDENVKTMIARLWQNCSAEEAEQRLPEEQKTVSAEIAELKDKISREDERVQRRTELLKLIPQAEEELENRQKALTDQKTQLEGNREKQNARRQQYDTEKRALRFASKTEAQKEAERLKKCADEIVAAQEAAAKELTESEKRRTEYETQIRQLTEQIATAGGMDKQAETDRKEALTQKKATTQKALDTVQVRLNANQRTLNNLRNKTGQLSTLEEQFTRINALYKTASGQIPGKERIMLETYIQMHYFERILERANTRFMVMSGGQYELRRKKETSGGAQTGLDLNVKDHYNGTERAVQSLSGGESFMAALSLALGLSDEIQASAGGVRLDTMFVDEGFGTLDETSLEQAMNALSNLADGSRLVGIISHVTELKNRIDKQIVITKKQTGGSEAKIIV